MSRTVASTSSFEAKVLMSKGKRATAAYIHADCSKNRNPQHLSQVLDNLLNPQKTIDDWETIDWCKWLLAGGRTPDEFSSTVRAYDNATTCGLVWTPNFVAYRCRTCGISPCMSLCTECFKKGNHARHDFNMFLSQAGGACDCGDTSVMKETGFCDRHGPNKGPHHTGAAPSNLMCVGEAMMPRIILRLVQHLRENSGASPADSYKRAVQDADSFITMMLDFNNMGGLMRKVMTAAMTNPQTYLTLNEVPKDLDNEFAQYQFESRRMYTQALKTMPNPTPHEDYRDCRSLQKHLVHHTFLEEMVFWMVKFEFPQKIVCLLLNMLPDPDYKEPLTRAFVLHYSRISLMLERSADPDTLSNRVVHVSVQLFSNESLALRMTENLNLLHVMVVSLKYMMDKILIKNTLHNKAENFHYVVDCAKTVMKDHCYWPLVSDLNNVLSHKPVALKFLADDNLLEMWFAFLAMFQGMNVNHREQNQHVEFEPNTYYAAFSAELEASAYPMWALVSHLTDEKTAHLTRRVIAICMSELREWFESIGFTSPSVVDSHQVSFHLPLHRYLSVFICQAVSKQGIKINEVLPSNDSFINLLMMHPLRVQVGFYEILNSYWLRNGLQIKGQAMTYIQCNFCNSMVDADLYMLQICSTRIPADTFMNTIIDKFHIKDWSSLVPYQGPQYAYLANERDTPMLQSFLTFLATLISVRTNLGLSDTELNRLEMVTLLCMGDKTHSQLMELMPERCGTSQSRDFESLLAEVADYRPPFLEPSGNMQQGMYAPKAQVWDDLYDPVHVLLRAVHRRDFQTSMDRYTTYTKQANKLSPSINPWPPFRTPSEVSAAYEDPRQILKSRVFHAVAFVILYKASKGHVSEHVTPLVVFLLEQAVSISAQDDNKDTKMCSTSSPSQGPLTDMDMASWYPVDSLFENLKTVIGRVVLAPEPDFSPITYSSDSDLESYMSDSDADMTEDPLLMLGEGGSGWVAAGGPSDSRAMMVFRGVPQAGASAALPPGETQPPPRAAGALALPALMEVDGSGGPAVSGETPSPTDIPALPPPIVRPALIAGNEVGRAVANIVPGTSNRELVPTTSQGHRKPSTSRRKQAVADTDTYPPTVKVNESMISLLLKLHSQLSGIPDSFDGEHDGESSTSYPDDSPIGDGAYYIGKLLMKISELDSSCKQCIQETRLKLWPAHETKKQRENKEREDRRRRAKERQEKLMREFADRQKEFLQQAMETNEGDDDGGLGDDDADEEERLPKQQEYDCVICNRSTPSTEDQPMGLVVLMQSTSVVGHRRRCGQPEVSVLPTCDEEKDFLSEDDTLSAEYEKRLDCLGRNFDQQSWFLSVNIGWDGGVHMQTCGHHLHLDCLHLYLMSLRSQQQRQPTLSPDKGEYLCPLCRQLANSVLPLLSQLGDKTSIVRSRSHESMSEVLEELSNFLRENDQSPSTSKMAEAIGKVMDDMSSITRLEPMFKPRTDNSIAQSLFLFVTSIARTNLEVELILRGGSLVTVPTESVNPLLPKRDCIVPLLHVLAVYARVTRELSMWPAWMTFQQLCGLQPNVPTTTLAPVEREVPLLLIDPIALLLQFVLLLPLHLDQTYFTTTVQMVYNLLYYQVVAQISCGLSGAERLRVASEATPGQIRGLSDSLHLINERLGHTDLYGDDDVQSSSSDRPQVNILALEQQVQKLCLPFLRIASLLKHHLYQQPLPDVRSHQSEFVRLVYYSELVTESMDWGSFNAAVALHWPPETAMATDSPRSWCDQFAAQVAKNQFAARSLLREQHVSWHPPRLLQLPREYEKIFTYYHERPCRRCQSVAQETSVCLLCGTIVCLKQNCCKRRNVCEAVAHAAECGAGTGVFLVVTSTYIIVVRGTRACLWGSLYLDDYEEEDRDLKRGKPLYLSKGRYQLLEQQWLAHRFDHTKKTWVHHRNAL